MAGFDGSGGWSWSYTWANEAALGNPISATKMDAQFADAAAGFQNCLTRDGQGRPSANIDWNAKKITNLANGTASGDAINLGQLTGQTTGNAFRKNLLINGGFDVWQAGAGGSADIFADASGARTRTADCWWGWRGGGAVHGWHCSQQTGAVNRYAMKWQRTAGLANLQAMYLAQSLETANVVRLKRGTPPTCYLSFYAKSGANYSGGNLTVDVVRGTGSDENVLDTYTGATTLATLAQAITSTLTRYSVAVPIDTSTNELGVRFSWTPSGVAGADDSVTLENVQLEVASAATDFEYLPFDDTLRRCMRYYEKQGFPYATAPAQNAGIGGVYLPVIGAGAVAVGRFPVACVFKRTLSLTATTYNPAAANAQVRNDSDAADCSGTTIGMGCPTSYYITFTGNAGMSAGDSLFVNVTLADPNF